MNIVTLLIAALLFCFFYLLLYAVITGEHRFKQTAKLKSLAKAEQKHKSIWDSPALKKLTAAVAAKVNIREDKRKIIASDIAKAGWQCTPEEHTAKKYICVGACVLAGTLFGFIQFYFGVFCCVLLAIYAILKLNDDLKSAVRNKNRALAAAMPPFVSYLCRYLSNNRDIISALKSYLKVASPDFRYELNILLTELDMGSTYSALTHFAGRIGIPEAYRLSSALQDISNGIDQTSALNYISENLKTQERERERLVLMRLPTKMKLTSIPAAGIAVLMLMYVLVKYVVNLFSTLSF